MSFLLPWESILDTVALRLGLLGSEGEWVSWKPLGITFCFIQSLRKVRWEKVLVF